MSKITQFDVTTAKLLRTPIEDALKDLATKYGISIKVGNGSFTSANLTFKLELATLDNTGTIQSKEVQDFKRYAVMFGLKATDLGREFLDWSGRKFFIVGAAPRSSKYPILVRNAKGQRFKFPAKEVQLGLIRMETGEV